MDSNIDKLKKCRTCAEALPIMETLKVRPSQRKLIETAIQLSHSKDPRQVAYGEDFMLTAIREIEDPGKGYDLSQQTTHMKKEKEADEITGALDSHQSSKIDMPYPKEGTDAPNSDIESMQTAQGEDQMGGIKENYPPMPGMGMPGMGMPGMAPDLQRQMAPQMPQMPQMNTPQMMRQMQYTVQEALKRYLNPTILEVRKLREAYIALDKKLQETQSQSGSMKLDLDSVKNNSIVREHVRETISGTEIELPRIDHVRYNVEERRNNIAQMDKDLTKGIYQ